MKLHHVPATVEHGRAQVVVEQVSRHSAQIDKGSHVTTQEVFQRLIEEKFQRQSPGVAQR